MNTESIILVKLLPALVKAHNISEYSTKHIREEKIKLRELMKQHGFTDEEIQGKFDEMDDNVGYTCDHIKEESIKMYLDLANTYLYMKKGHECNRTHLKLIKELYDKVEGSGVK